MDTLGSSEAIVRIGAFAAVFVLMAIFELWSPRLERAEMVGALKSRRWFTNLAMVLISSAMLRVLFPAAAVGAAIWAQQNGWGLLTAFGLNPFLAGVLAFIILDFAVWLEHIASHKIPLLWRIHRMHHADTGFDVTTGLRFHPLEIVLSMIWKAAIVVALGASPLAVLVFEIVLNGTAMFNHSNARLPLWLDRHLRKILVTPDMHRVHHSTIRRETDSNYGFNFPFWDRLFSTYNDQPERGHKAIDIGLEDWRDEKPSGLIWALMLPFRGLNDRATSEKTDRKIP